MKFADISENIRNDDGTPNRPNDSNEAVANMTSRV